MARGKSTKLLATLPDSYSANWLSDDWTSEPRLPAQYSRALASLNRMLAVRIT